MLRSKQTAKEVKKKIKTNETLRDTLASEVREVVDVMEVCLQVGEQFSG